MSTLTLTPFQAGEVEGLLDVVQDEIGLGSRTDTWGLLTGRVLSVLDPVEAAQDLRDRAAWLEDEGYVQDQNGGPGARSLRALADKIEVAQ